VIAEMIAAEAAQVSDDTSLDDLWEARAYDPQGELQGIGYGYTAAEACAGAWIVACGWPDECHLLDASVALRTSIGSRRMSWPSSSSRSKDHEARPARREIGAFDLFRLETIHTDVEVSRFESAMLKN
jgi:hypothetical protein